MKKIILLSIFSFFILLVFFIGTHKVSAQVATTTTIRVITNVVNDDGGTATLADFDHTLFYYDFPFSNAADDTYDVNPGRYAIFFGYSRRIEYNQSRSAGCTDGIIEVGQHITCIITYDDPEPPAFLRVITKVINDNLGTASADYCNSIYDRCHLSDFGFFAVQYNRQLDVRDADITITLESGPYDLYGYYSSAAGYTRTLSDGCSGTLATGETKTCVITYDDPPLLLPQEPWCYQESANVATACGGLAGGSYIFSDGDTLWMDGDWHTTLFRYQAPETREYFVTYEKPVRALPTSVLKVKDFDEAGDNFYSLDSTYKIPEKCFSQNELRFRFSFGYDESDYVKGGCWDGKDWVIFRSRVADDAGLVEEAMIWGMAADKKDCKALDSKDDRKACEQSFKNLK
ncbi:hypothetical protein KW783_02580 [Candidatus Parcubacteria bacterium]|nr:hypothetical protein [Candidatus Parcubacteria bacterium]